jgi:hypothetical protein
MSIIGGGGKTMKDGSRADYSNYACGNAYRKGGSFCENKSTVSRRKIENTIVEGLRKSVLHPLAVERFLKRFLSSARKRIEASRSPENLANVEREIVKVEAGIDRLVSLFAAGDGALDVVSSKLKEHREKLESLKVQAVALRAAPGAQDLLPRTHVVQEYANDLADTLAGDREKARVVLEKYVGKIKLAKKGNGPRPSYWASGRFDFGPVDASLRSQGVAGARCLSC